MEATTPAQSTDAPSTLWAVFAGTVMRLDAVLSLPADVEPTVGDLAAAGLDTTHITTAEWLPELQWHLFYNPDQLGAGVWQARRIELLAPAVEMLFSPLDVEADNSWDRSFQGLRVNTRGCSLPDRFYVPATEDFSADLVTTVLRRLGLSPAKKPRGTKTGMVVLVELTPPPADAITTLVSSVLDELGYVLELDAPEYERRSVKSWPADEQALYRRLNEVSSFDYAYAKVEQLRAAKLAEALRDAMERITEGR